MVLGDTPLVLGVRRPFAHAAIAGHAPRPLRRTGG